MSSEIDKRTLPSYDDESDWVRAVASLIKLTEEGKLKWKSASAPRNLQREPAQQVDVVFTAEYEGKRLRLYVEAKKVEDSNLLTITGVRRSYPYWTREVVLELGDKTERGWYTIPETVATEELLESVKYQVLGVDDFLNKVLDADESAEEVGSS